MSHIVVVSHGDCLGHVVTTRLCNNEVKFQWLSMFQTILGIRFRVIDWYRRNEILSLVTSRVTEISGDVT